MFYSKYDAMDIAEYVLWFCEKVLERPITNLKLQKILYYIQGRYLSQYNKPLFDNEIQAWKYGPVVPDVYYSYSNFISSKITNVKPSKIGILEFEGLKLIEDVILEKINLDPWELVEDTHNEAPWAENYIEGENLEISINDLKEWFRQN